MAGIALAVGILTLFSMTKIWAEGFWKAPPANPRRRRLPAIQLLPVSGLAICTVLIGLFVDPLHRISLEAAEQLLESSPAIATTSNPT